MMELTSPAVLSRSRLFPSSHFQLFSSFCKLAPDRGMAISSMLRTRLQHVPFQRSYNCPLQELKIFNPPSASGSGVEASMSDHKESSLTIKTVEIVVESKDSSNIQLRVDLPGEETRRAFDVILTNLGRTAPPIPGFRREKGGKTSKVPKSMLLKILGEERVTKFTIQEILTSVLSDYIEKEKLGVKDDTINTTQTEQELRSSFSPGNPFGFNVVLKLQEG